jgi:hypothetical protein
MVPRGGLDINSPKLQQIQRLIAPTDIAFVPRKCACVDRATPPTCQGRTAKNGSAPWLGEGFLLASISLRRAVQAPVS